MIWELKFWPLDFYPIQHFIDEFTPISLLPPLDIISQSNIPATNEKEVLDKEQSSKSTDSDLEILGCQCEDSNPKGKEKKRTRSSLRLKVDGPASLKSKAQSSISSGPKTIRASNALNHHFFSKEKKIE